MSDDNNTNPPVPEGDAQGGDTNPQAPVPPGPDAAQHPPLPPVPPVPPIQQPPSAGQAPSGQPLYPGTQAFGQPYGQQPVQPHQPAQPQQPMQQHHGQVPPPPPVAAPYPATPQTSNNALIAILLAICSWVFCPLIFAIAALVVASSAKKEIEQSNGWTTGSGLVTATKILAWINIAVVLVSIVVLIVALAIGAFAYSDPSFNPSPSAFFSG